MSRISKQTLDKMAELLMEWPATVEEAVANPRQKLRASAEAEWATQLGGEIDWAFEDLKKVVTTEELYSALSVVVQWGMAGLLRSILTAMDPDRQLADEFADCLVRGGYVPFVASLPRED